MKVSYSNLQEVSIALLKSIGASEEEAAIVVQNLIMADMRGIHTHGVNFIPKIFLRIENAVMNIPTNDHVISSDGAVCHIDGNNGFGQVASAHAMDLAIEKGTEYGIGMSLIRNTNHIGLLAFYSMMAARKGMIGFALCNSAPAMAPWGGAEAFFGTNPLSIAVPGDGDFPIVLDMSTSVVARGKIRRAIRLNEEIPQGWALNADGQATTDPNKAMEGTLLPVGGPKGSGMAFFIDLLCGIVSGSKFSRDVLTFHKPIGPTGVGAMMLAIDIKRFIEPKLFQSLLHQHVSALHEAKKADGVDRIYLPGEIEAEMEMQSDREGIELDELTVDELNTLLEKNGAVIRLVEY